MINSKRVAAVFSFIIAGAVLWPVRENFKEKPADNFPLSYYPMFSAKRGDDHTLNYIVGYDSSNMRYYVPYRYIGNGGLNQVRRQLNKKIRMNDTKDILQKTLKRIEMENEFPYNQLLKVELARGNFNLDSYFRDGRKLPEEETILDILIIDRP